jgi:hypothetical protein
MKKSYVMILALALPMGLSAQQPAPSQQGGPITSAFRARYTAFYRNLPQAFDSIPESKFGYKPTPAQLTIGYIAQHLASDNYFFCNNFGEMKATRSAEETSTPDSVKATWPKAKLVAQLRESITFCQNAFGQLDDAKLGEAIQISFGAPRWRSPIPSTWRITTASWQTTCASTAYCRRPHCRGHPARAGCSWITPGDRAGCWMYPA